jgi:uncharacterized protein
MADNQTQNGKWGPGARFHVMVKPIGPLCNLNCDYCFYLSKEKLLNSSCNWKMSDEILEQFIKQYIEGHGYNEIIFSWQGGEPTLLGLDFFKKVIALEKKYCPSGKRWENDLQTNGILLDDEWCKFLKENNFLVGLSIDGPRDKHRFDKNGGPTFDKVFSASQLLKKYDVPFNALVTLNRDNAKSPLEVYRFLRDELSPRAIQFNPCVEPKVFVDSAWPYWDNFKYPELGEERAKPGTPDSVVTDWSVDPDDYGTFLCEVFDEWYRHDVGKTFVYNFEYALSLWMGIQGGVGCVFALFCGKGLAIEHDGNVYSCDHLVYPKYHLGNIKQKHLAEMAFSQKQQDFGLGKHKDLTEYCRKCEFLFACNGECPKNRFIKTPIGEPGLNYLCSGLKKYFSHIKPYMNDMAHKFKAQQRV